MARQKSINKRLSKYSRRSTGSAVLDPDTNILDDPHPYWWKNLESNTVLGLSRDSNLGNQTSQQLDNISHIGASAATDGWWNALETSNASQPLKSNTDNVGKDVTDESTETESEGEPRVLKRKFPFRSKVRKKQYNDSLKIANNSVIPNAAKHIEETKRKSTKNDATLNSKLVTDIESFDKVQEDNFNHGQTSTDLLKKRPNVFDINYKDRTKNAFVDILKGDQLEQIMKEGSASSEAETVQFVLSFENEYDSSNLPVPKAQSTILEGSVASVHDKTNTSNSTESLLRKPRSKFMTHRNRNTQKNLFENVLENEKLLDKIVEGESANQNASAERGGKSMNESTHDHVSEAHTSNVRKGNERVAESAPKSTRKSTGKSSPTDRSNVIRTKSRFLTRSCKNEGKNLFQQVLDDGGNVDSIASQESEISLTKGKEGNTTAKNIVSTKDNASKSNISHRTIENDVDGIADQSKAPIVQDKDDKLSKSCSVSLHKSFVRTAPEESEKDALKSAPRKRKTDKRSTSHAVEISAEIQSPEIRNAAKELHDRSSRLQTKSFSRATSGSESDEAENVPMQSVKSTTKSREESNSQDLRAAELPETRDALENKRGRSARSKHTSMGRSESDQVETTPRRSTRSISKVQELSHSQNDRALVPPKVKQVSKSQSVRRRSNLPIVNESGSDLNKSFVKRPEEAPVGDDEQLASADMEDDKSPGTQDILKPRGDRSTSTRKHLSLHIAETEAQNAASTPRRSNRSMKQAQTRASSQNLKLTETPVAKNSSTRHSVRQRSRLQIGDESESEEDENFAYQRKEISAVEEEAGGPRSRALGDRSTSSRKQLAMHTAETEAENTASTPKRSSRSTSQAQVQASSRSLKLTESPVTKNSSTRHSVRQRSRLQIGDESESEEDEDFAHQRKEISAVEEEAGGPRSRTPGDRSVSPRKHLSVHIAETEIENAASTPRRSNRSTSQAQVQASSRSLKLTESPVTKNSSTRHTVRQRSRLQIGDESESEEDEDFAHQRKEISAVEEEAGGPRSRTPGDRSVSPRKHLSVHIAETEIENAATTPRRSNRGMKQAQTHASSQSFKLAGSPLTKNSATRHSVRQRSRLQIGDDSESEEDEDFAQQREEISAVEEEADGPRSKTLGDRSTSSRKQLSMQTVEAEAKKTASTPRRSNRNASQAQVQASSRSLKLTESPVTKHSSTRHSVRQHSRLQIGDESELEEDKISAKRRKEISAVENDLVPAAAEKADDASEWKSSSVRLTSARKHLSMHVAESDVENTSSAPRQSNRTTSQAQARPSSASLRLTESSVTKTASERRSVHRRPRLQIVDEPELEEEENSAKRRKEISAEEDESVSLAVEEESDWPDETQDNLKTQRDRLSSTRKHLTMHIVESDAENVEAPDKRDDKTLRGSRKQIVSPVSQKIVTPRAETAQQADRRVMSQKYSQPRITSDSVSRDIESLPKRIGVSSIAARLEQPLSPVLQGTTPQRRNDRLSKARKDSSVYFFAEPKTDSPNRKKTSKPSSSARSFANLNNPGPGSQQSIKSFFKADRTLPASQALSNKSTAEEIKKELEKLKRREMVRLEDDQHREAKLSAEVSKKRWGRLTKQTQPKHRPPKQVPKAFLVNGQVYKVPRLPRPQRWVTDRFYNHIWKCMEPKYKLETRAVSEKFVHQLCSVMSLIAKRKSYIHYKAELHALMKEMARLGIVRTRNDFYHFCQDFFPYELRIKTVPMLLPGNKRNIPYDADKVDKPLLES